MGISLQRVERALRRLVGPMATISSARYLRSKSSTIEALSDSYLDEYIDTVVDDNVRDPAQRREYKKQCFLAAYDIEFGSTYLMKLLVPHTSEHRFSSLARYIPGFFVSGRHGDKIASQSNIDKKMIYWLTEITTDENHLNPHRLDFEIMREIHLFFSRNQESILYLDTIEYLVHVNGFEKVTQFIKMLSDITMSNNAIFIVPVMEAAFDPRRTAILSDQFSEVQTPSVDLGADQSIHFVTATTMAPSFSYLAAVPGRDQLTEALASAIGTRPTLALTTHDPQLVTTLGEPDQAEVVHLVDSSNPDHGAISASRLEFEVLHRIITFMTKHEDAFITLIGIDGVRAVNGWSKTLLFIKQIIDIAAVNHATFLLPITADQVELEELLALSTLVDSIIDPKTALRTLFTNATTLASEGSVDSNLAAEAQPTLTRHTLTAIDSFMTFFNTRVKQAKAAAADQASAAAAQRTARSAREARRRPTPAEMLARSTGARDEAVAPDADAQPSPARSGQTGAAAPTAPTAPTASPPSSPARSPLSRHQVEPGTEGVGVPEPGTDTDPSDSDQSPELLALSKGARLGQLDHAARDPSSEPQALASGPQPDIHAIRNVMQGHLGPKGQIIVYKQLQKRAVTPESFPVEYLPKFIDDVLWEAFGHLPTAKQLEWQTRLLMNAYHVGFGGTYLIECCDSNVPLAIMTHFSAFYPTFLMTMSNPETLPAELMMPETKRFWLTDIRTTVPSLNPKRLDFEIFREVHRFVKQQDHPVVFIDQIEQLFLINGFNKMSYFLTILTKLCNKHHVLLLASIQADVFPPERWQALTEMFQSAQLVADSLGTFSKQSSALPTPIEPAHSYLILDEKPKWTHQYLIEHLGDRPYLCITTTYPQKLVERYGYDPERTYWLTERSKSDRAIHPTRLEFELTATVIGHLKRHDDAVVLLDGIQHLIFNNPFDRVMVFLKHITDMVSITNARLVVPANPASFERGELNLLKGFFNGIYLRDGARTC